MPNPTAPIIPSTPHGSDGWSIPYICYHIRAAGRQAVSPNMEIAALAIRLRLHQPPDHGYVSPLDIISIAPSIYHARIQFDESKADMSRIKHTYDRQQWIATGVTQASAVAGFASFAAGYKYITQRSGHADERLPLPVSIAANQSLEVPRLKAACRLAGIYYPIAHAAIDAAQLVALDTILVHNNEASTIKPKAITPIHLDKYLPVINAEYGGTFDSGLAGLGTPDPDDPRQFPTFTNPDSIFYEIIHTAVVVSHLLGKHWACCCAGLM
jgi:hypothetical protein